MQGIRHKAELHGKIYTAKGSSAEVLTQAIIAQEVGYLNKEDFDQIEKESLAISKMLFRLIDVRRGSM